MTDPEYNALLTEHHKGWLKERIAEHAYENARNVTQQLHYQLQDEVARRLREGEPLPMLS